MFRWFMLRISHDQSAIDKCTLCDMCYLTKCPYVPPHPLNIDLPKLILRHRVVANEEQNVAAAGMLTIHRKTHKTDCIFSGELRDAPETTPKARTPMYEEPHVEDGVSRELPLVKPGKQCRPIVDTSYLSY